MWSTIITPSQAIYFATNTTYLMKCTHGNIQSMIEWQHCVKGRSYFIDWETFQWFPEIIIKQDRSDTLNCHFAWVTWKKKKVWNRKHEVPKSLTRKCLWSSVTVKSIFFYIYRKRSREQSPFGETITCDTGDALAPRQRFKGITHKS